MVTNLIISARDQSRDVYLVDVNGHLPPIDVGTWMIEPVKPRESVRAPGACWGHHVPDPG